ncbi:MAG: efflux RND transporter permease subunit, partial [Actinomycetota bacterium]|nr:efflux RND transporter permease subunit [Actinomycetota bacterium]
IRRGGPREAARRHDAPSTGDFSNEDAPDARPGSRRARRAERRGGGGILRVLVGGLVLLLASAVAFVIAARAGLLDGVPGVPTGLLDAATGLDLGSPVVIDAALGALVLLGIVLLAVRASRRSSERPSGGEEDGFLVRLYTPMLRWALRNRPAVLVLALVFFVGGLAAIPFLPVSFFPAGEERIAQARVELPPGAGLQQTDEAVRPFEEFLGDDPDVRNYQISIAGEDNFDPNSPIRSANQAQAFINIEEEADPQEAIRRISDEGREIFGEEAFRAEILQNGPPQGELQAIITVGTEGEREEAAGIVSDEISGINSVINVRSDVSGGTPEIVAEVDPERSAQVGLSPQTVSGALATLLGGGAPGGAPGAPGGPPSVGGDPVSVSLPSEAIDSVDEVRALPLAPGLAVGDVAEVTQVEAPAAKSRVDGEPAVTVSARIVSQDTQTVSAQAQTALAELNLPDDVEVSVGGENEDIEESFRNLFYSIIVALALVFILLVVFFGSILIPLVILLAVPLTTAGAFGALLLTNTALSLPSLLGILLLIGIVVSNAILLVDFAIKARSRHEDGDEAVVEAGRARLRPILMTALATIFALLPLALGLAGGGSGLISASLAITVIGGLATSTFLTLLVVPVGYSLLESARSRRKKRRYA